MMFPHTITVWSRSRDETYSRTVVRGVLWEDNRGVQLRKTGVSSENGIMVIVPTASLPPGFAIRPKDWMILGVSSVEPASAKELSEAGAVTVSAADLLDCGGLPHWEVTGK